MTIVLADEYSLWWQHRMLRFSKKISESENNVRAKQRSKPSSNFKVA